MTTDPSPKRAANAETILSCLALSWTWFTWRVSTSPLINLAFLIDCAPSSTSPEEFSSRPLPGTARALWARRFNDSTDVFTSTSKAALLPLSVHRNRHDASQGGRLMQDLGLQLTGICDFGALISTRGSWGILMYTCTQYKSHSQDCFNAYIRPWQE